MEMWYKLKDRHGRDMIKLSTKNPPDRIISLIKCDDGIIFQEACDDFFKDKYTKEETLKIIDEMKEWVNAT